MEIKVIITAEPALMALLENLGKCILVAGTDLREASEGINFSKHVNPAPAQNVPAPATAPIATMTPAPSLPTAPVTPPMTNPVLAAPSMVHVTVPPVAPLPTVTPTFTLDQLAVAATGLVDAGKVAELMNLLGHFGCQALTQLPAEMYGHFATALRGLGAQI